MTVQDTSNHEVIGRLTRENENLNLRSNQLQLQGKGPSQAMANVKPMAQGEGADTMILRLDKKEVK